jgi:pimeloyl-ACP methyl ester carboxylesterase
MLVALRQGAEPHRLPDPPAPGTPTIRSATDRSGRAVAWTATGFGGATLVDVSGWLTHLLLGWRDPAIGGFQRDLCAERRVLRYDRPGMGLSPASSPEHTADAGVDVLEAVIDASGDERVALFAHGFGAATAIRLAVQRPQLVSHLVLFGASSRTAIAAPLLDALQHLIRADWDLAARTLADMLLPGGDGNALAAFADYQRASADADTAAATLQSLRDDDVSDLLADVRVPTLLLHRRDDRVVPLQCAREMAARIPGARLTILDGAEHIPHFGETAAVHAAIARFLEPAAGPLTPRELEVLRQIGEGLTNCDAAIELGVSEATVARHLANIYLKLDVATRGAAVARARRGGLL